MYLEFADGRVLQELVRWKVQWLRHLLPRPEDPRNTQVEEENQHLKVVLLAWRW